MSTATVTVPVVTDLVAGEIVSTPYYYVLVDPTTQTYSNGNGSDILDYSFADKVSVGGGSTGTSYTAEVDLGGQDDVLFTGVVDAGYVIPKAMALECASLFNSQVIDLSAGPMTYARYQELGTAAKKTGAYLLTTTGKEFEQDLAQMDSFKSIAMVDIAKGTAILEDETPIRAGYVEIAGGAMKIEETFNYSGNMTIVEGLVNIGADEIATYTGIFNDLGDVKGHGALDIIDGTFSVASGAGVDVKTWLSKGKKNQHALDYIDSKLDYKGHYLVGANTTTIFFASSSLTVNAINNINGLGGTFEMEDEGLRSGDETIDVLGAVAKGEEFEIGNTDALVLGAPTKFKGLIESMTVGNEVTSTEAAHPGGEVALVGIWNFVSVASNKADTETIVTMKDTANKLLAHIDFADITAGTMLAASYFEFFDQIKGVTPTTVITPTVPPSII